MVYADKRVNLILSGGGVRGIAYLGAFSVAEERGYQWGNIAGVSAGALVGAFSAAGYDSKELIKIMDGFDFENIKIEEIAKKVPIVSNYVDFVNSARNYGDKSIETFLNKRHRPDGGPFQSTSFSGYRGEFLNNLITYCKEGCLFDGDYLEEWVFKVLSKKGIKTFGDLKGGICDPENPQGYRVRMTAVDASRGRIIVLPDDIAYYGINPDKLEVSKAVRMSTSIPFVFKPVEIKKTEFGKANIYNIIDGGVFDNFPTWLVENTITTPVVGLRLSDGKKKGFFSLDTPLNIIKGVISAVHDIGIPENKNKIRYVAEINVSKVSFMDVSLTEKEKDYLKKAGVRPAGKLFNRLELSYLARRKGLAYAIYKLLGKRSIFK